MADPKVTTPQDDPFDIGDTGSGEASTPKPSPTDRPRNPDGTYAPVTPPAAEVTTPNGEVVPTPAPKHPAYLVKQAQDHGYTDEEINEMSPGVLGKTVHQMMQQQLSFRDEMLRARQVSEGEVRAPQPPAEEDIVLDFGADEEGRPLTEKDFGPGIVRAMKAQARLQRAETKKLQEALSERDKRDEQRDQQRAASIYDAAFASLGADYEHIVGKGPGRDMGDAQKAEYRRRIAILTEAQADPRQLTVAQVKARVKSAADLLFPPVRHEPYAEVGKPTPAKALPPNGVPAKPRITEQEWEDAALSRPTARKGDDLPNGEAKAVRNLTARMNQEVIPDSEELDGFPG